MDLNITPFLAALFSVTLTLVNTQRNYSNRCGLTKMFSCNAKLRTSIGVSNPQDQEDIDKEALRSSCSKALADYQKCMGPVLKKASKDPRCPSVVKMYQSVYSAMKDGYTYLCDAGFNQYVKYVKCISSDSTRKSVAPCTDNYWTKWQDLFVGGLTNEYSKAYIALETCKSVDTLSSCIYRNVNQQCGVQAAKQQKAVINRMTRPTTSNIICDQNKGTHKWATFWILLILGIAAFGAVYVVLVKMKMMTPFLPIPGLS